MIGYPPIAASRLGEEAIHQGLHGGYVVGTELWANAASLDVEFLERPAYELLMLPPQLRQEEVHERRYLVCFGVAAAALAKNAARAAGRTTTGICFGFGGRLPPSGRSCR